MMLTSPLLLSPARRLAIPMLALAMTACAQSYRYAGTEATPAAPPLSCPAPAPAPAPVPVCPTPGPVSVVELTSRPAERALIGGLRAYDDAQYRSAEQRLTEALNLGLAARADRAAAHKTLAFVYCSSRRMKQCEASFRAAREADPAFALNKAEAGHPVWGPVYKKVVSTP